MAARIDLMTSKSTTRLLLEAGGLFLIGDGIMGILRPRRQSLLWYFGPELARAVTEELADHPKLARSLYLTQVALGTALFASQARDCCSD
jgi:hypothetical protein